MTLKEKIEKKIFSNLGISSGKELEAWNQYFQKMAYRFAEMPRLAEELKRAKEEGRAIHIISDYDCDGITSTAILVKGLRDMGFIVTYHIPLPMSEGYGMTKSMAENTPEGAFIITVDNGIVAFDAVKRAKELGHRIWVLDHHMAQLDEDGKPELPEADGIIDPAALEKTASFRGYCGAGLAFKLIQYMGGWPAAAKYVPLAAIATIADVMPLHGENYSIVKWGLKWMSEDKNLLPGVQALKQVAGLTTVTAEEVGYSLAPLINAPGRIYDDGPEKVLEMLLEDDLSKALGIAEWLKGTNDLRKAMGNQALEQAEKVLEVTNDTKKFIICRLHNAGERIVGITAGKLREQYGLPAVVLTESEAEPQLLKGSGRSTDDVNLTEFLRTSGAKWESLGGHAGACGCSMLASDYETNRRAVITAAEKAGIRKENVDEEKFDIRISPEEVHEAIEILETYEPFGQGNPKPVFRIEGVMVDEIREIGKGSARITSGELTAVGFGCYDKVARFTGETLAVTGCLKDNVWKGTHKDQVIFTAAKPMPDTREKEFVSPDAMSLLGCRRAGA